MKIGDYVVRKRYNRDILFEIFDIKENICYLRGVELRLIADSDLEDLELSEVQPHSEDQFTIERQPMIRGKILHLDGDEKYLNMCEKKYKYNSAAAVYSVDFVCCSKKNRGKCAAGGENI